MKANYEKRLQEGKQLTLYESEVRVRSKERKEKLKLWHMILHVLFCTLDYHSIKLMDIWESYFVNIALLLGLAKQPTAFSEIPS